MPEHLILADPTFYKSSSIHMLLGAEEFFNILNGHCIHLGTNLPTLVSTKLGWIVGGRAPINYQQPTTTADCYLSVEDSIRRFWEIEECLREICLTPEDKICEQLFQKTTFRDATGRFVVQMPLKETVQQLGNSEQIAVKRFLNIEKRLNRDPALRESYHRFMNEYETLGHMTLIQDETNITRFTYYLPHHYVKNENSSTTKLRVVFDASCKTSSGLSLNDTLLTGPNLQQDLFSIVLRFREHRYVMTADISKMYRQVRMIQEHTDLQRIVWRNKPTEPLKIYRLNTVTYGTAPASYLATRCLKQIALDERNQYPKAAEVIQRDFYVDDLLTGCDTVEQAQELQGQLITVLERGKFQLHKWCANHHSLLEAISLDKRESKYVPSQEGDNSIKTLGLWWNPSSDCFKFSITIQDTTKLTKRIALSLISRIFDPLGLLGPLVMKAKLFIQRLWEMKAEWDAPLSEDLKEVWKGFLQDLHLLENLKIPRAVISPETNNIEIHGFCDASESGYGAVIYIRQTNDQMKTGVNLLCAKSRVAPLKKLNIPRLELCGALLLAQLLHKVQKSMIKNWQRSILWSDSTIVLAWIASSSGRWKTFVANRVSEIQTLTERSVWRHVPTRDNPADVLSRGLTTKEIIDSNIWWRGPSWLRQPPSSWPENPCQYEVEIPEERSLVVVAKTETVITFERFSSFCRLIRTVAYVKRFISCLLRRNTEVDSITSKEFQEALNTVIRLVQQEGFQDEIAQLRASSQLRLKGRISSLCPFLDNADLLRVGGRLSKAQIPFEHKHQLLLPDKHHFTRLLFEWEHRKTLHAGPQLLLASIRQKFWPLGGRNLARKTVHRCIKCFKCKPREITQRMGELPVERLKPSKAFTATGVDYCGPILIKSSTRRGSRGFKAYIALFVCMVTKVVHIELVGDLSTKSFLAALKRFFSRRGKAKRLMSDNGTNFIGAAKELHKRFAQVTQEPEFAAYLAEEDVEWSFIPPRSPHFGGLWEAAIKSCKFHMKRIIGNALLTYEEMYTILTQIESSLNSRPLCPLSSDPNDLMPLTPGHFLVGGPLNAAVEPDLTNKHPSALLRWERVQQMFDHFWKRWSKEYLVGLQERQKWRRTKINLQVGQLVLLKDDNQPPLCWKSGRVVNIHLGGDGLARVADIRTKAGTFRRSITKLCPLPQQE